MIEPLAAMRAACMAIADGEANEVELEWTRPVDAISDREERTGRRGSAVTLSTARTGWPVS